MEENEQELEAAIRLASVAEKTGIGACGDQYFVNSLLLVCVKSLRALAEQQHERLKALERQMQ